MTPIEMLDQQSERAAALCDRAIKAWGAEAQMRHSMGELAELIVAIEHWFQGRYTAKDEVREEFGDVMSMLSQIQCMHFTPAEVRQAFTRSLDKLEQKLVGHEAKRGGEG